MSSSSEGSQLADESGGDDASVLWQNVPGKCHRKSMPRVASIDEVDDAPYLRHQHRRSSDSVLTQRQRTELVAWQKGLAAHQSDEESRSLTPRNAELKDAEATTPTQLSRNSSLKIEQQHVSDRQHARQNSVDVLQDHVIVPFTVNPPTNDPKSDSEDYFSDSSESSPNTPATVILRRRTSLLPRPKTVKGNEQCKCV